MASAEPAARRASPCRRAAAGGARRCAAGAAATSSSSCSPGPRASACAWSPARSSCSSRVQGLRYLDPSAARHEPERRRSTSRIGRVPRPDDRHARAGGDRDAGRDADRRRRRRSGSSSTAARAGSPAIVETSIEMIAGTPDIVIAIFGLALFQLGIFAPLSFRSSGGGVYGRSFFAAGADGVAARAAADLHRDAQRAARDPAPAARGVLRARQDPHRDDPPRAAAEPARRHRDRARRSAWGGSSARPRSSCCCSAASLQSSPAGSVPLLGFLRGTGSTLTELHPRQLARRRGQRAAEGLRRRVRADADRPRCSTAPVGADLAPRRRRPRRRRTARAMSVTAGPCAARRCARMPQCRSIR